MILGLNFDKKKDITVILALPALLCIFLSKNIAYRHLDQTTPEHSLVQ